ncbi:MAG: lytic transglycosylase, partial [Flavobacteriaceae bacterium]|nr:lytic transglycosylase [Flavobacteriaceae bacterium]
MRILLICILIVLSNNKVLAQEGNLSDKPTEEKQSLPKKTIQLIDSITVKDVSGDIPRTVVKTTSKDTTIFDLQDISQAKVADSLWLNELYSTDRFEEVYGSISNMKYEVVDYEELPTELLKQRLEDLNARTPFNVEYNPALESVIKGYLKNRRRTMGKLMALSDYYFPMFEQELDKHNLPLEIKYLA